MKSFNPEGQLARQRSQERLPEMEEALYEVLVPETKRNAIRLEEFADLYDENAIKADLRYIKNLETRFESGVSTKFGELFEAIVDSQIEDADLMGPNASVIVPSRFDDVANGVDSIVEFEEEGATSHLALAVDVTKGREGLKKKFERIRTSIEEGELSRVKYFKSENFRGELRNVPRVVIGADHSTVENISDLLLRFIRMKKSIAESRKTKDQSAAAKNLPKEFAKIRAELSSHPLQGIVLTEISEQLHAFQNYAERNDQPRVAENYKKVSTVIDEIIHEKESASQAPLIKNPDDEIFRMIMDEAKLLS